MTDIRSWLSIHHLEKYADSFVVQEVGIDQVSELTDADLKELGVAALGDRKRFLKAASHGGAGSGAPLPEVALAPVRAPAAEPSATSKAVSAATPPSCSPISPATRR